MWIKSSDTDLTDRRLLEAGPLGRDLHHRAQLWMSSPANLTNGHISRRALRSLDDYDGITEDGGAVTLASLAERLVKLELWKVDGDGYYDLRYEGLNPADLIEKRREAGRRGGLASAGIRRQKYGTAQPLVPEAHEAKPEAKSKQTPNRTRTRTRSSSKRTDNQPQRPNESARANATAEVELVGSGASRLDAKKTAGKVTAETEALAGEDAEKLTFEDLERLEAEDAAEAEAELQESTPSDAILPEPVVPSANPVAEPPSTALAIGDIVNTWRGEAEVTNLDDPEEVYVKLARGGGVLRFRRDAVILIEHIDLAGLAV